MEEEDEGEEGESKGENEAPFTLEELEEKVREATQID